MWLSCLVSSLLSVSQADLAWALGRLSLSWSVQPVTSVHYPLPLLSLSAITLNIFDHLKYFQPFEILLYIILYLCSPLSHWTVPNQSYLLMTFWWAWLDKSDCLEKLRSSFVIYFVFFYILCSNKTCVMLDSLGTVGNMAQPATSHSYGQRFGEC